MAGAGTATTHTERLLEHLFGAGQLEAPLAREMRRWVEESARFRAFCEANRDKVRKKVRTAGEAEALLDVRAELLAARLFCEERRFAVEFEAYGSGKKGPDLTLVFRANQRINVEVTRLRAGGAARLPHALLAKLRQLPSGVPNALLLMAGQEVVSEADVAGAARTLKGHAERKEDAFFSGRGYEGARDFHAHFLRLSAVLVAPREPVLWQNPEARHRLPAEAATALRRCLEVGFAC